MKKVEQIIGKSIVLDYDKTLSKDEIFKILQRDLEVVNSKNPYIFNYQGNNYKLFVKQITYLGHPHPLFKKRIQISKDWNSELIDEFSLLIGIYHYKSTLIYTIFDKSNFIKRKTNNSSAHISSIDLLKTQENGVFTKIDFNGNLIISIKGELFKIFLIKYFTKEEILDPKVLLFENFKKQLKLNYHGIECYKEMIEYNYRNKYQPEWFAFFIEFKFELFLLKMPELKKFCTYQSNKSKGDIDLDLNFNNEFLGDIKTHTNRSNSILGNDAHNINVALNEYGKVWYVVFNHDTIKDSEFQYEVTLFWNKFQNKDNLLSYSQRMKNNVTLTDLMILEINNNNAKYLSAFNQGVNSNQLAREKKIKIDKKYINNFLIYFSKFGM